jgi:hypothetical protein
MKSPPPEALDALLYGCRSFLHLDNPEQAAACLLDYYKWRVRGVVPSGWANDTEADRLGRMVLDQIGIAVAPES